MTKIPLNANEEEMELSTLVLCNFGTLKKILIIIFRQVKKNNTLIVMIVKLAFWLNASFKFWLIGMQTE